MSGGFGFRGNSSLSVKGKAPTGTGVDGSKNNINFNSAKTGSSSIRKLKLVSNQQAFPLELRVHAVMGKIVG